MDGAADMYRNVRERLSAEVLDAGPDGWSRVVPATPIWRVHDVLSHLSGTCADLNAVNLDGLGSDEYTAAQVDPRRDVSTPEVIDEWRREAEPIEAVLDDQPSFISYALIGDAITHALDVEHALGTTTLRDDPAVDLATKSYSKLLAKRVADAGLAPVRVETPGGTFGETDADVVVRGATFDVLRALTGRRTLDEIRAFDWTGDPEPYLEQFSQYGVPSQPLGEGSSN